MMSDSIRYKQDTVTVKGEEGDGLKELSAEKLCMHFANSLLP